MRPTVRLLVAGVLAALVATGGVVAVGTVLADDEKPPTGNGDSFSTTPIDDFDSTGLVARRAAFCSAIDPRQVEAALGSEPDSERTWQNGDRVEVADGVRDVVHEYGCEYVAGGTTARAWVFAPPVDRRRAQQLIHAVGAEPAAGHCSGLTGSSYGDPSVAWFCAGPDGSTASFHGLFGDAWLSCELRTEGSSADSTAFDDRAGRWCVGVAQAASSEQTAES